MLFSQPTRRWLRENETHSIEDMLDAGADLDGTFDAEKLAQLGENPFQMTVAALRLSRAANAVAQAPWQDGGEDVGLGSGYQADYPDYQRRSHALLAG